MGNRTKLKVLLVVTPLLCITIIGLCMAYPFYPQLADFIKTGCFLLVLFIVAIIIRMYRFRNTSVSLREFMKTRPLFIKYLMQDRRIIHAPQLA